MNDMTLFETHDDDHVRRYLRETSDIAQRIDWKTIAAAIALLRDLRDRGGRLFLLGVGGSAANSSHAANDFRKIAGIESYATTDNIAELTAWTNDIGWHSVFVEWLRISRLSSRDCLMIFSVGGGSATVSRNLILAMDYGRSVGASIVAVVGRDGGYARTVSDICILVPTVAEERVTPHSEGWQGIVWHCLVSALAK